MFCICSDDLDDDRFLAKRHSDAVFTDNYSRYRKQMAVKKFLNSVLAGKRRYGFFSETGRLKRFVAGFVSLWSRSDSNQLVNSWASTVGKKGELFIYGF